MEGRWGKSRKKEGRNIIYYQRQGEGKSMKERKETEKEGRKEGRSLEHGRKRGRNEGDFFPTKTFPSYYDFFLLSIFPPITHFLLPSFNPSLIYSTQKPCFHVSILSYFICSFLHSFTSSYTLHSQILSFSILSPFLL